MKQLKSFKSITLCMVMLFAAAMFASCSTDTEKKLNGEWEASEYDEDLGGEATLYLNLVHESAEGRVRMEVGGEMLFDFPITWFANEKEMDVTLELDDMDWGDFDPAEGQLLLTRIFGATSSGEAKWRIVKLDAQSLTLSISGDELEFRHL